MFAYSLCSRVHSVRGNHFVRLRCEKHKGACCIMLHGHVFDTWRALLWSSTFVATRVQGTVRHRWGIRPSGSRRDGKTISNFSQVRSLALVLSQGIPTQNFSRPSCNVFLVIRTSSVIKAHVHLLLTLYS